MRKPIIAIKLSPREYAGLVALANAIFVALTGNLLFPTPAPTLADLQTALTAVVDAIAAWGPRGNHGSHDDLVNLRLKELILHHMLKSEAQYVQNVAQATAGVDYASMAA